MAELILNESSFNAHVGFSNHYEYQLNKITANNVLKQVLPDQYKYLIKNPDFFIKKYGPNYLSDRCVAKVNLIFVQYNNFKYEDHPPILKFYNGHIRLDKWYITCDDKLFKWIYAEQWDLITIVIEI